MHGHRGVRLGRAPRDAHQVFFRDRRRGALCPVVAALVLPGAHERVRDRGHGGWGASTVGVRSDVGRRSGRLAPPLTARPTLRPSHGSSPESAVRRESGFRSRTFPSRVGTGTRFRWAVSCRRCVGATAPGGTIPGSGERRRQVTPGPASVALQRRTGDRDRRAGAGAAGAVGPGRRHRKSGSVTPARNDRGRNGRIAVAAGAGAERAREANRPIPSRQFRSDDGAEELGTARAEGLQQGIEVDEERVQDLGYCFLLCMCSGRAVFVSSVLYARVAPPAGACKRGIRTLCL